MDSPVRVASRHFGHAPAQSPSTSYNGHSEMWFAPHGRRIWEWRRPVEKSQAVYAGGRCRIKYGPPSLTRHVHGPVQNRNVPLASFMGRAVVNLFQVLRLTCPVCVHISVHVPVFRPVFLVGSDTHESLCLNQRPGCRAPRRSSPISTLS
jgi:hypothetical protein